MAAEAELAPRTVSVTELRAHLREILERAYYFDRRYLVVRNGDALGVLLGIEDYRRLLDAPGEAAEVNGY
jgi:prevent-host-death family protein